jgi:phage terminase small subunit
MTVLANAKHEAVALAYIADPERIGWRAWHKVYPKSSQGAAEVAFSRLLRNAKFSARVAELAEAAAQGAVMAAREVLEELTKIARANMADFVRAFFGCGDPAAAVDQLTPAQTAALAEVTVEQFMDGRGDDARQVRRVRFKLASKIDALELLGKHHKLYTDRVEHEYGGVGLAERLAAALARVHGQERNNGGARSDRLDPSAAQLTAAGDRDAGGPHRRSRS